MKNKQSVMLIIIASAFIISVVNYMNIIEHSNIRTVEFLSIFAIGALSAILLKEIITRFNIKD